jgi:hypothetical protein
MVIAYTRGSRKRRFVDANAQYRNAAPSGALSTAVVATPSKELRVGDTGVRPNGECGEVESVDDGTITFVGSKGTHSAADVTPVRPPEAGCPVFVRYPSVSPAVWMGRDLPVLCRGRTEGARYVGVMHTRQCRQCYRNSVTYLVQVLGAVTMRLEYRGAEWKVPEYVRSNGTRWVFGAETHPSGGVWLAPPGRVSFNGSR